MTYDTNYLLSLARAGLDEDEDQRLQGLGESLLSYLVLHLRDEQIIVEPDMMSTVKELSEKCYVEEIVE